MTTTVVLPRPLAACIAGTLRAEATRHRELSDTLKAYVDAPGNDNRAAVDHHDKTAKVLELVAIAIELGHSVRMEEGNAVRPPQDTRTAWQEQYGPREGYGG